MQSLEKGKWARIAGLVIAVSAAFDWIVADRWQAQGRVIDADTKEGIASAWVLADFNAQRPLLNLPIPPHPNHRTGACMGTRIAKTDEHGRFRFNYLTYNRALAKKSAYVYVFKPGWISSGSSIKIRSSLFAAPPTEESLVLSRGPGDQRSANHRWFQHVQDKLDASELTYTAELVGTLHVASQSLCDPTRTEASIAAMRHALVIAKTFDERERVRATCGLAAKHAQDQKEGTWPFDCSSLPFKHQPNSDVLSLEAELKAKRNLSLNSADE